jgi:hypothetical protein
MTYQLLTGKPSERNNTWAMIRSHLEEPLPDPPPCSYVSSAPAQFSALAKPEERSACCEFVAELGR